MKKIIFAAIALMAMTFTACDDKVKILQYDELPALAQQTISEYFADEQISVIQKEYDDWGKKYTVLFVSANGIEFNKKGEWREITCRATKVPDGLVPVQIREYVEKTYPGTLIWKINKDTRDYEVELNNFIELKFDLNFNIIDIEQED